jgi:putative glutamine amidotransferase
VSAPAWPVIGMPASVELGLWGAWEEVADLLPHTYAVAVQRAGGLALILPPDPRAAAEPDRLLDILDGLLLAGGCDIDPATYGASPHPETKGTHPPRDAFEVALAHRALERDMPVLGVCRGMQLLNVAGGGTLHQHLPDVVGHDEHRHTPGSYADHEVRLREGSLTARVVGAPETAVKSHHHQAPDRLGEGIVATGWDARDGAVEAVELPDRSFAVGVLWHPEEDEASHVIATFVAQARERMESLAR